MRISTKGRYALRTMLDLAMNENGDYIPLREISNRQNISVKYLEQIMPILNKAGFIKSFRGNTGGYKLDRLPKEYIVGDILRAAEGSLAPIACLAESENTCERKEDCKVLPFWQGLEDVINNYVDNFTLEDLLKQTKF